MSPETRYKIEELEQLTGLSRRLIYDYISRELVPAAMGSGKGAYYLQEHYDRLRLISLLRTAGFRLERIEEALKTWEADEIARIVDLAEGRDVESLNSLNEWLSQPSSGRFDRSQEFEQSQEFAQSDFDRAVDFGDSADLALPLAAEIPHSASGVVERLMRRPRGVEHLEEAGSVDRLEEIRPMERSAEYSAAMRVKPTRSPAPTSQRRSQTWERVAVSPDIEINYRRRRDSHLARRVTELLEFAEALFRQPARTQDDPDDGE